MPKVGRSSKFKNAPFEKRGECKEYYVSPPVNRSSLKVFNLIPEMSVFLKLAVCQRTAVPLGNPICPEAGSGFGKKRSKL